MQLEKQQHIRYEVSRAIAYQLSLSFGRKKERKKIFLMQNKMSNFYFSSLPLKRLHLAANAKMCENEDLIGQKPIVRIGQLVIVCTFTNHRGKSKNCHLKSQTYVNHINQMDKAENPTFRKGILPSS